MITRIMVIALVIVASTAAFAEKRVALVIGNSEYRHTIKLPNTRNDADAIARLLKAEGFSVFSGMDQTKQTISDKLADFAAAASDADVALFFYAGHAVQIGGRNLMVPVDADLKSDVHAKTQTVDVEEIVDMTMSSAKVKIVLLDACRDNPFAEAIMRSIGKTRSIAVGAKGLAEMKASEGTMLAFATGPGQTAFDGKGGHSPFTKALLQHLATPGLEINLAMTKVRAQVQEDTQRRQLPWTNTSMTGMFYLSKAPAAAGTKVAAVTPPASSTVVTDSTSRSPAALDREGDRQMWKAADDLKAERGYRLYLERYPNGEFAEMARLKLAAASSTRGVTSEPATVVSSSVAPAVAGTEDSEDALGLNRGDWRNVQTKLTHAGYSLSVDGVVGAGTREALKEWQEENKYPATGYLTRAQLAVLNSIPVPKDGAATRSVRTTSRQHRRPSREQGASGGNANAVMGTIIGIGAGVALGRALRR